MAEEESLPTNWILLESGERVFVPKIPGPETEDEGEDEYNDPKKKRGFHLLEKVRNVWGSTAGAGSDFFHVYRKQRAREMARQDNMEAEWEEQKEAEKFQQRREERLEKVLIRSEKKAARRKKRKLNAKQQITKNES